MGQGKSGDEIREILKERFRGRAEYSPGDIDEVLAEAEELKSQGTLFSPEPYRPAIEEFAKRPTVVKALCLHIAHDCNLACRYCFAEEGEYHGRRALMSLETGKKALDFLVKNSGLRRNLEVDFFGGEPRTACSSMTRSWNSATGKCTMSCSRSTEEKKSMTA